MKKRIGPTAEDHEPVPRRERFRTITRATHKHEIYSEIRDALLAGTFEPGESITVKGLVDEIGAGAMPIREALQRLAAEGALTILPTGRVQVPQLTAKEFDDIRDIRLRLEGLAAQQAAENMDSTRFELISARYLEVSALVSSKARSSAVIEGNYQFHFAIYQSADNRHLLEMIYGLWLRVSPLLSVPFKATPALRNRFVSRHNVHHRQLLVALKNRKGEHAELAIQNIIAESASWYHEHHVFLAPTVPNKGLERGPRRPVGAVRDAE